MTSWNEFGVFEAPGRKKEELVRLTVSQEFINTHMEIRRLTPLYQFHAHVLGRLPQINLISKLENSALVPDLTTLNDSTALFEGIKRPHDDEDNGDSVLIYVLRPTISIEWAATMSVMAQAIVPPQNSVLTVLVRTNLDLQDDAGPIHGCVTRVEWVKSSPDSQFLPNNSDQRYETKHW